MTVSNAFSKPDQLSGALRDRIMATAEELGYVGPDPAARALARGTAGSVGVLMTDSLTWAFTDEIAMAFLGAILMTADHALIDTYAAQEGAVDALDDQRLAAAIMWVTGMAITVPLLLVNLPLSALACWRERGAVDARGLPWALAGRLPGDPRLEAICA